jgi:hypothetical protein
MSVPISQPENAEALRAAAPEPPRAREKPRWETPRMEEAID